MTSWTWMVEAPFLAPEILPGKHSRLINIIPTSCYDVPDTYKGQYLDLILLPSLLQTNRFFSIPSAPFDRNIKHIRRLYRDSPNRMVSACPMPSSRAYDPPIPPTIHRSLQRPNLQEAEALRSRFWTRSILA